MPGGTPGTCQTFWAVCPSVRLSARGLVRRRKLGSPHSLQKRAAHSFGSVDAIDKYFIYSESSSSWLSADIDSPVIESGAVEF